MLQDGAMLAVAAFCAPMGPVLILVIWVGVLYNRVLHLPPEARDHGLKVLDQLTCLMEAVDVREKGRRRQARG